jgi:hypothetical protein
MPCRAHDLHPATLDRWEGTARENGYPSLRVMLILLHYRHSFGVCGIADLLRCSRWTIRKLMRACGIPRRTRLGRPLSAEERTLLAEVRHLVRVRS